MKKRKKNFNEARKFARSLKIKNWKEWREYCKSGNKPDNIPANPNVVFQNEWKGTGDWLGTGAIANKYKSFRSFIDARKFVNNLGIKNQREWATYSKSGKKPHDIPSDPQTHFKNKRWISWGDWLGSGTVDPQELSKNFLVFSKARKIIHSKNFKSGRDWKNYTKDSKFPKDIPKAPGQFYKNKGWKGMGDWLGTNIVATRNRKYLPYKEAREYILPLKLTNEGNWRIFRKSGKLPSNIPSNPNRTYKNKGWQGMGDWLGTGNISSRKLSQKFLSFNEARTEARKLAIKYNLKNWEDWVKAKQEGIIPQNIPSNPNRIYVKNERKK